MVDLRYASIIAIAAAYMLFDIFNKRNVPSIFVYATLGYGIVLTLLYLNLQVIFYSALLAIAILGLGYFIYKLGQIGAADVVEFAAISLMLPTTPIPALVHLYQFAMPFIATMAINTGVAVFAVVPYYYIPRAFNKFKGRTYGMIRKIDIFRALVLAAFYLAFVAFLLVAFGLSIPSLIIIMIMAVGSILITLFVMPITRSMIRYTTFRGLEPSDAIALNLMPEKQISDISRKIKGFGGLVTGETIAELKRKAPKLKLPVYRNAVPFALPIFIGVLTGLMLGNLMLLIFV